jgi:hypothetical protein
MKRLLLLLLALSAAPAHAAVCHEDAIRNLTTSGTILYLVSGQIFQVYPGQETKAIFWEPLDSLTRPRKKSRSTRSASINLPLERNHGTPHIRGIVYRRLLRGG